MKKRAIMIGKVAAALTPAMVMICSDSPTLWYVAFLYLWWLLLQIGNRNREVFKRWLGIVEE